MVGKRNSPNQQRRDTSVIGRTEMQRRRLNRTCPGRNWVSSPVACARFDVPLPHSLPPTRQRESKDSLPGCAILERIPQTPTTPTSSPAHRATAPSSCILISPFPIQTNSQTHSFPPAHASFPTQASRILIPADPFRARFPPAPPPQPPRPPWTSPIPTTRRSGHRPSANFTKLPRTAPADRSPRSRRNPPPAPRRAPYSRLRATSPPQQPSCVPQADSAPSKTLSDSASAPDRPPAPRKAPYSRFPAFRATDPPRSSLPALHRPIPRIPGHSPTPTPLLTHPQRLAERRTAVFRPFGPPTPRSSLPALHRPIPRIPGHSPTPTPLLTHPQRLAERRTAVFRPFGPPTPAAAFLRPTGRFHAFQALSDSASAPDRPPSASQSAPQAHSPRRTHSRNPLAPSRSTGCFRAPVPTPPPITSSLPPRIQASSVRKALQGPSRRLALPQPQQPLRTLHAPLIASPRLHSMHAPSRHASPARTASHHRASPDPHRVLLRSRNPAAAFWDPPCARARASRDARKRSLSYAAAMRIGQPLPTKRCLQALPTYASYKRERP